MRTESLARASWTLGSISVAVLMDGLLATVAGTAMGFGALQSSTRKEQEGLLQMRAEKEALAVLLDVTK